jgi:hypothetical protein
MVKHYNHYPIEAIEMMARIWGREATAKFCLMSAFKYRSRLGLKGGEAEIKADLEKERRFLELHEKYSTTNVNEETTEKDPY